MTRQTPTTPVSAAAVLDRLDRLHQQLDQLIRNEAALPAHITGRRSDR
jgi:hypothetical protein